MEDIGPRPLIRITNRLKQNSAKLSEQTPSGYKSIEQILASPKKSFQGTPNSASITKPNRKKALNVLDVQQFLDGQLNRSPLRDIFTATSASARPRRKSTITKPIPSLAEVNKHFRNSKKELKPVIQHKIPKEILIKEISRLCKMDVKYPSEIERDRNQNTHDKSTKYIENEIEKQIEKRENELVHNLYIPGTVPIKPEDEKETSIELGLRTFSPISISSAKDSPKSVKFVQSNHLKSARIGKKRTIETPTTCRSPTRSFNLTSSKANLASELTLSPKNHTITPTLRNRSPSRSSKSRRRSTVRIDTIGYRCLLAMKDVRALKRSCTFSNTKVSQGFKEVITQVHDAILEVKQVLPDDFLNNSSKRVQISSSPYKLALDEKEVASTYRRDTFSKAIRHGLTRDERYMYTSGTTWDEL
jgi:hypothetical protein